MADFNFGFYEWRGKRYARVTTLCRAVDRVYGNPFSVSFDRDAMHIRLKRGDADTVQHARTFDDDGNSLIASERNEGR